jgi:hypothetical protein
MRDWTSLILEWGSPITQLVLLCMQIHTYRRTRHYSLAILVVASILGLLASTLIGILNSEVLVPRLRTGLFDAMILSYAAYAIWYLGSGRTVPLLHSVDRRRQSIQPPQGGAGNVDWQPTLRGMTGMC